MNIATTIARAQAGPDGSLLAWASWLTGTAGTLLVMVAVLGVGFLVWRLPLQLHRNHRAVQEGQLPPGMLVEADDYERAKTKRAVTALIAFGAFSAIVMVLGYQVYGG